MEVPAKTLLGMRSLRHLWLDDNALTEIPVSALNDLSSLQAMTLALNRITHIPDYAFRNLSNLVVLYVPTSTQNIWTKLDVFLNQTHPIPTIREPC